MVQLKEDIMPEYVDNPDLFQYLYGAIKSLGDLRDSLISNKFQYLYGAIKRSKKER